MVMGKRPDVPTAPPTIAAFTVLGLAEQLATDLATVPLRRPWQGPTNPVENVARSVTRHVMRTFMGYASSLPIEEFRSLEVVLDDICAVVLPPVVHRLGVTTLDEEVGGVPGTWYRPPDEPRGTILYLHGGGYIGTSPRMYAAFAAWLAVETHCEVLVVDYRLAPEFPFPAGLEDAVSVCEALLETRDPSTLFVAGDSGGGGLANSLLLDARALHLPSPAGLVLFSPEVDLILDEPSVSENAGRDILPWNVPVAPYLHGRDPRDELVSAVYADLHRYPPTLVVFGDDEIFRDPIRRFVDHLRASAVDTTVIEEPGMFHVFPFLMPWAGASRRVYRVAGDFVGAHLGRDVDRDVSEDRGPSELPAQSG